VQHATVFPWLTYDDPRGAIAFFERAFGAEQHTLDTAADGSIEHAELRFGNGVVMLGSATPELPATRGAGGRGLGIYVVVDDIEAHYTRARDAGAEIVTGLRDLGYSREYSARDPEGNAWHFGTYQPLAPKL
jgi:uncharacterized glyoxalase superfamily protein PhnB